MLILRYIGLPAAIAAIMLSVPAFAQSEADVNARIDNVLGDHARYETAISVFQQAVATNAKEDVAALVRYPIVVSVGARKQTIRSAAEFLKNYNGIMTGDIVDAIKNQKYQDLFVNDQGVMFGNGQAWLNGICLDKSCGQFVVKVVTLQHAH